MYKMNKASIAMISISVLLSLGIGALFGSFLLPVLILFVFILGGMWLLNKIIQTKS